MLEQYLSINQNKFENKLILKDGFILNDSSTLSPALFLDRDGVVIKDCHYISNPNNVILEKGITKLLSVAKAAGLKTVLITNQSGISRDLFSWEEYFEVTDRMLKLLGDDLVFDAIYSNGYMSSNEKNNWRKPNIGMIESAKKDLELDIKYSLLIGDRLSDIKAGYSSGIETLIHVLTGHGAFERELIDNEFIKSRKVCNLKKNKLFLNRFGNSISLTFLDSLDDFPFSKLLSKYKNFSEVILRNGI